MVKEYNCPPCKKGIQNISAFLKANNQPCPHCGVYLEIDRRLVNQFYIGQWLINISVLLFLIDAFVGNISLMVNFAWLLMMSGGYFFVHSILKIELKIHNN